jgi:hypothetical protein
MILRLLVVPRFFAVRVESLRVIKVLGSSRRCCVFCILVVHRVCLASGLLVLEIAVLSFLKATLLDEIINVVLWTT